MKTTNAHDLTRQAVILAALLHDIGKFVQRASAQPTGKDHQTWGADWFDKMLAEKLTPSFGEEGKRIVRSAISSHHDTEEYIMLADEISAGERISRQTEETGDPSSERLISIFSRVSVSPASKKECYYNLAPLGSSSLKETFPEGQATVNQKQYRNLLEQFEREIKSTSFKGLPPRQITERIYYLLWRYTWCIPSAVYKSEPDVSLFDHLKTTCAIAACLHDYEKKNQDQATVDTDAFFLIGGDISGIQQYIFEVLTQRGKIAKRLRARSLYVQVLSEISAHKILHLFDLPGCNLLSSAGGNFLILAPNIEGAEEDLQKLQLAFDEWTYSKLKTEISVTIAWVRASGSELQSFGVLQEKLRAHLHQKKGRPHYFVLTGAQKWKIQKFLLKEVVEHEADICEGCRKDSATANSTLNERLCERCEADVKIGTLLPKARYIAFLKDDRQGFPVFDYSFEIWSALKQSSSAYSVLALNNPVVGQGGFKYLCTHIPTREGINCQKEHDHGDDASLPALFECIASKSDGDELLGYAKVDIDNMGKIFRLGFTAYSISRFCSLSRMLEMFFSGYLDYRMRTDYNEVYTIFSGGDDFFVTGPWNRIVDFIKEMKKEFARFTGHNPDLTFSAGIIFTKPYEPISFCSEMAREALDQSKSRSQKNSITLFDQSFGWHELDEILSRAEWIVGKLRKEPPDISRGFVYNLLQYGEMALKSGICEKNKEIKTQYLKFVPLLTYDISRNLGKESQKDVLQWAESLKPNRDFVVGKDLPYLKAIMKYVLTYTRKGG